MIKKWVRNLVVKETRKESELNKILDKISNKEDLTKRESDFLDLYNKTQDSDYKDYSYLSRHLALSKIEEYILKKKKIYCDLYDRDGKVGELIIDVDKIIYKLILKHGDFIMEDKYLYNISYNFDKDIYSLTSQDEYFEELMV
jgi:hypothetical protein